MMTWHVLEELAHRLEVPQPPPSILHLWQADAAARDQATAASTAGLVGGPPSGVVCRELLVAWESSLLRGALSRASPTSFLRALACHHVYGHDLDVVV